jgi:hypothetical protein
MRQFTKKRHVVHVHYLSFSEVLEGSLAALLQAAESGGKHGFEKAVGLGPRRCKNISATGHCFTWEQLTQSSVAMQTDSSCRHARATPAVCM